MAWTRHAASADFPAELLPFAFDDDGCVTESSAEQEACEGACAAQYAAAAEAAAADAVSAAARRVSGLPGVDASRPPSPPQPASPHAALARHVVLQRERHVAYLLRALEGLSPAHASLDASRAWIAYWALHALDVLGVRPTRHFPAAVAFLSACAHPDGGFGGGPGQLAHTASTYAAVLALLVIGTPEALGALDARRPALLAFFRAVKDARSGGFRVQRGGEADVRGAYTVLAVARVLGLLTPDLAAGAAAFLLRCQTWEGGFGGEPGCEAHGGYTFCAVAGLTALGGAAAAAPLPPPSAGQRPLQSAPQLGLADADVPALRSWLGARQTALEGGFAGRAGKLVDSCYSFWVGAAAALLPPPSQPPAQPADGVGAGAAAAAFDAARLQAYVLSCCQAQPPPSLGAPSGGGLHDKPGKARDLYHTCYALSGLSVAQHCGGWGGGGGGGGGAAFVVGPPANAVPAVDPLLNVLRERRVAAEAYFAARPLALLL